MKGAAKKTVSKFAQFKQQQGIVKIPVLAVTEATVFVPQGYTTSSGYTDGRVLATHGLATCVGVALVNARGACLSHIDADGEAIIGKIAELQLQLMAGPPAAIHIASGSPMATLVDSSTKRLYDGLIKAFASQAQGAPVHTHETTSELGVDPRTSIVSRKLSDCPIMRCSPGVYYWKITRHPFSPAYLSV
jgi:hypothetical protein